MLIIKIFKNTDLEKEFSTDSPYITVGRDEKNMLCLQDDSVSRIHAVLYIKNNLLCIKDLGSKNKILINGFTSIEDTLNVRDEVEIGPFKIIIENFSLNDQDVTQEFNQVVLSNVLETDPDTFTFLNKNIQTELNQDIELINDESIENNFLSHEKNKIIEISVMLGEVTLDYKYFDPSITKIYLSNKSNLLNTVFLPTINKDEEFIVFNEVWQIQDKYLSEKKEDSLYISIDPFIIKVNFKDELKKLTTMPFDKLDTLSKKTFMAHLVFFIFILSLVPFISPVKELEKEEEIAIVYKAKPIEEIIEPQKKSGGSSGASGAESNSKTSKAQNISKTFNNAGVMKALARLTQSPTGAIAMNQQGTKDVSSGEAFGATTKSGRGLSALGGGNGGEGVGFGKGNLGVGEGIKGVGDKKGIHYGEATTKTIMLGSIDPEEIRKILERHLPQFRHCYQKELDKVKTLKGLIDLEFTIGKDGKVVKTDIKSKDGGFSNDGVGCLSAVLKFIQFPSPKGGGVVDVRQPLNFYSDT